MWGSVPYRQGLTSPLGPVGWVLELGKADMGKHSRTGEACPQCGHESHADGKCFHCGIFTDRLPVDYPCIKGFPVNDPDTPVWAGGEEKE